VSLSENQIIRMWELCLNLTKSNYMLISMRSERTGFGTPNCAKEIPLVQSFLSGCHSMPLVQSIPAVPCAVDNPSENEANCTSPSSAVAENAWRYIGTAQ